MIKKNNLFFITTIFSIINSFILVMMAYIVKKIVDTASLGDLLMLYNTIVITLFYILLRVIVGYLYGLFLNKTVKCNLFNVKQKVFRNIISSYNINVESSQAISLLNNDVNMLEEGYYKNIFRIINSISSFIFALIYMLSLNIVLTLVIITTSFIPVAISSISKKILSNAKKGYSNALIDYVKQIKECILGKFTIQSFGISKQIIAKYTKSNDYVESKRYKSNNTKLKVNTLNTIIHSMIFNSIMLMGAYLVITKKITIGTLLAATQLTNNLASPIFSVSHYLNEINSLEGIVEKIKSYTEISNYEDNSGNFIKYSESIEVRDLDFSYNSKILYDKANYCFLKEKKYLLIGESGCGKSTLLKLLINNLQPQNGEVLIDGINITTYQKSAVSKTMAMIHQDVFLFNASMYDNVTLFTDFSEEEVKEAFEKASLTKYIPEWNKIIEEGGANFSGGEKQRIAIARAVLRKTPVLLIDEMTSSLDPQTAKEVENVILNLKDTTCIIISHNISGELLSKVDEVIKVEDKKLINLAKNNL